MLLSGETTTGFYRNRLTELGLLLPTDHPTNQKKNLKNRAHNSAVVKRLFLCAQSIQALLAQFLDLRDLLAERDQLTALLQLARRTQASDKKVCAHPCRCTPCCWLACPPAVVVGEGGGGSCRKRYPYR